MDGLDLFRLTLEGMTSRLVADDWPVHTEVVERCSRCYTVQMNSRLVRSQDRWEIELM